MISATLHSKIRRRTAPSRLPDALVLFDRIPLPSIIQRIFVFESVSPSCSEINLRGRYTASEVSDFNLQFPIVCTVAYALLFMQNILP